MFSLPPRLLILGPQPYQYQSEKDGWYEGVLKGRQGLFPANFAQISGSEDPHAHLYMHTTVTMHIDTLFSYTTVTVINLSESKGHDALAHSLFSTCEQSGLSTPHLWQPIEQVFHSPWQYVFSVT